MILWTYGLAGICFLKKGLLPSALLIVCDNLSRKRGILEQCFVALSLGRFALVCF